MKDLHIKRYLVYYFVGDFWSSQGETRKTMFVEADNEEDAERFSSKFVQTIALDG